MIIELSNGLDHLFQWDAGQKVKVPENVPTVHFKWGNDAVPFDVVDGWVEIAPELTQKAGDILLWAYKEDHTMDAARIPVEKRPKPADYIYTPTEIKTWESLDKRIEALEKGGGIACVSSVNGETGHVTITASGIGAATPDEVETAVNSAWAEAQKALQPMFDAKQPKGDYITQAGLQSATNAALAQAKASGDFDGAPGAPGTPGTPGAPGADGYSPTVTVEQTDTGATITATDKTGTTTATVKNGSPGTPGASGTTPHIGDNGNWYLGETDTGKPSQGHAGAGMDVTGATVGQTVKISAVDGSGVPTAWVPVDMASGGGIGQFRHIRKVTIPEDATTDTSGVNFSARDNGGYYFGFDTDEDGNPFELTEIIIFSEASIASEYATISISIDSSIPNYGGAKIATNLSVGKSGSKVFAMSYTHLFTDGYSSSFGSSFGGGSFNNVGTYPKLMDKTLGTIKNIRAFAINNSAAGFEAGSWFEFYGR